MPITPLRTASRENTIEEIFGQQQGLYGRPVSGSCSVATLTINGGYRLSSYGITNIPAQVYTGSLSTAGFYDISEAVNAGAGYRYFYVDPRNPSRIYVSDNPPSTYNKRTISGTEVVYICALRMTSSSNYSAQSFFKNKVMFRDTLLNSYSSYGSFIGIEVFNIINSLSNTQNVNLVSSGRLPSDSVVESVQWFHFCGAYNLANNAFEYGPSLSVDLGSSVYPYNINRYYRSTTTTTPGYNIMSISQRYRLYTDFKSPNNTFAWSRSSTVASGMVNDGAALHALTLEDFEDKLMFF